MPDMFVADLDLHAAVDAARRGGAVVVPRALTDPFRRRYVLERRGLIKELI